MNSHAHARGQLAMAVALLSECLGPLEVSAAVIESDDGDQMEALIAHVRKFVADASGVRAAEVPLTEAQRQALTVDKPVSIPGAPHDPKRPEGCEFPACAVHHICTRCDDADGVAELPRGELTEEEWREAERTAGVPDRVEGQPK